MNVFIIPEDCVNDRYTLLPIIGSMMAFLKKKNAKVKICENPRIGGIDQALNLEKLKGIIDLYPMVDIFLLLVDRDGNENRKARLNRLEEETAKVLSDRKVLFAENAHQEVEVWALAGLTDLPKDWKWAEVRAEVHPKEKYFEALVKQKGLTHDPGRGRKALGLEAARNYKGIRSRCAEVKKLEQRIKGWVEAG